MDETLESYLTRTLKARKLDVPKFLDLGGLIPRPIPAEIRALALAFDTKQDGLTGSSEDLEMCEDFALVLPKKPENKSILWTQMCRYIGDYFEYNMENGLVTNESDRFLISGSLEEHGLVRILFMLDGQTLHVFASVI
jgi:hypothetical protein